MIAGILPRAPRLSVMALDARELDDEGSDLDPQSLELLRQAVAEETTGAGRFWADEDLTGSWLGEPVAPHPGRFELVRCLGMGGFGAVYEARDHARGTTIAVKLLMRVKARDIYLFKQEFRGLTTIRHPHLIELHELHADRGRWFFTMPLIDGVSFFDWVSDDDPLARPRLMAAAAQLTRAVRHLHQCGRVHRDIKPSNVMVTVRDGKAHVVLLDFGLAASPGQIGSGLVPGRGAGTTQYLAPENETGDAIGPAADWFAVGIMLLEALTGKSVEVETTRASAVKAAIGAVGGAETPRSRLQDQATVQDIEPVKVNNERRLVALTRKLLALDPAERPGADEILALVDPEGTTDTASDGAVAVVDATAFIGRESELREIAEVLETPERSAVILLRGPSGIGKTSLAEHVLSRLEQTPGLPPMVLRGRCYAEECVPYKGLDGVVDELAHRLMALSPERRQALRPPHARALVRLFPVLAAAFRRSRSDPIDPDASLLARAVEALCALIAGLGQDHRVVLFIDDLQWGDADSAALLEALLLGPEAPRVIVVATLRIDMVSLDLVPRPTGGSAHAPWLRKLILRLRRDSGVRLYERELGPLSPSDAESLAQASLGGWDPQTSRVLARAAQGVPYFVHELARHVMTRGEVARNFSVVGLVLERINGLPAAALRALELVAVAGIPVSRRLLATAVGRRDAKRGIDLLRREELVRVDGVGDDALVWARHDRIRLAVAGALDGDQVRADFRALADAAAGGDEVDVEVLAIWLSQAGDLEAAIDPTIVAARRALDVLSFERAANLFDRARGFMGDDDPRIGEVERGLADCELNLGHMEPAAKAYLAASRRASGDEAMDLLRRAAECTAQTGDIGGAQKMMKSVLRGLSLRPPRFTLGALYGWRRLGRQLRRRGLEFEDTARARVPEAAARLDALLTAGMLYSHTDFVRSWYFFRRGLLAALNAGSGEHVGSFIAAELAVAAMRGKEERSPWEQSLTATGEALAMSYFRIRGRLAMGHTVNAFCHGDWELAIEMSERAKALMPRRRDADVDIHLARVFGLDARYFAGRWSELMSQLDALEAEAQEYEGGEFTRGMLQLQSGWMRALIADDPKTAEERLERQRARTSALNRPQHVGRFVGLVDIALYASEGRGDAGYRAYRGAWPGVRRSRMARLFPMIRVTVDASRLRVALAMGDQRAADRACKALERSKTRLGRAWMAFARAASAADRRERLEALSAAESGFHHGGMGLHVVATRWRRGQTLGRDDEEGARLLAEAERTLAAQGIASPARVVAMLLPGSW